MADTGADRTDQAAGVLKRVASNLVIPVVVLDREEQAEPLADALVAGGLPVAEVTFRTPAAAGAIARIAGRNDIVVGAGTVVSAEQVDRAVEAGARFLVSPGVSPWVVQRAQELGVAVLPGVATATEIQQALHLGISTVKFFPAGVLGGPKALAAFAAPFTGVRFVPTGGVSPANLAQYLALPAVAAVGGSWVTPRDAVGAGDFARVRALAAEAHELSTRLRASA